MKKIKLKRAILSLTLLVALLASCLSGLAVSAQQTSPAMAHSISKGALTLTDVCGDNCAGHTVTGTSASNTITVLSGKHTVTLKNVSITADTSPISVASGAELTLKLEGDNILEMSNSYDGYAVISVPSGATLTVEDGNGEYMGSLDIRGTGDGAGIGGSRKTDCGTVKINGGTVKATSGSDSAAIGGGSEAHAGNIIINGGAVTAIGFSDGAAIGGGNYGTGGAVTINGGAVYAYTQCSGAGIGSGRFTEGDCFITINGGDITAGSYNSTGIGGGGAHSGLVDITITGGNVTASSKYSGAAIGSDYNYTSLDIKISGGSINAAGNWGSGIGTGSAYCKAGSIVITGGNIKATSNDEAPIGIRLYGQDNILPTDGNGNTVSLAEYTLEDSLAILDVTGLTLSDGEYGINDVATIDQKLYLYLPEGVTVTGISSTYGDFSPTSAYSSVFTHPFEPNDDGVYEIYSPLDLHQFSMLVNSGLDDIDAILMDDIDFNPTMSYDLDTDNGLFVLLNNYLPSVYIGTGLSGDDSGDETYFDYSYTEVGQLYERINEYCFYTTDSSSLPYNLWTPIGTATDPESDDLIPYTGVFDGNGKVISGLVTLDDYAYSGLFGISGYSTVKNVAVVNSTFIGTCSVGAVLGLGVDVNITECASGGNLLLAKAYDEKNNSGGIAGGVVGVTTGDARNTVSDCFDLMSLILADITAGGLIGAAENTDVYSCYDDSVQAAGSGSFGRIVGVSLGDLSFDNTYYVGDEIGKRIDGICAISEGKAASGELAYLLQDGRTTAVWGQTIGEEERPMLGGMTVYMKPLNCTDAEYNNTGAGEGNTDHTYSNDCDIACNKCKAVRTVEGHIFGEWTTKNGTKTRACAECGYIEREKVIETVSPEGDIPDTVSPETDTASSGDLADDTAGEIQIDEYNVGCGSSLGSSLLLLLPLFLALTAISKKKN